MLGIKVTDHCTAREPPTHPNLSIGVGRFTLRICNHRMHTLGILSSPAAIPCIEHDINDTCCITSPNSATPRFKELFHAGMMDGRNRFTAVHCNFKGTRQSRQYPTDERWSWKVLDVQEGMQSSRWDSLLSTKDPPHG
jgi:hypothetical protein